MSVNNESNEHPVKRYILDPSALVYGGIGKIKQWVDAARSGTLHADLVFYVPIYTLKELEFLKKVFNHSISANVRESIKFIDNQISSMDFSVLNITDTDNEINFSDSDNDNDDDNEINFSDNDSNDSRQLNSNDDVTDFESYNLMKHNKQQRKYQDNSINSKPSNYSVTFILENEDNTGPDWKITSGYRRSTPLLSDLPAPINGSSRMGQFNHENGRKVVGVFGNNIPGTFNMSLPLNRENSSNNNINYINDINNSSEKAKVPIRLKYLIRSCVQKQYIENKDKKNKEKIDWVIICEDTTTSIWLKSFGLFVKNVNEVQKELELLSELTATGLNQSLTRSASPIVGKKVLFDPITNTFTSPDELTALDKSKKSKKSNTNRGKGKKGKGNKNSKKKPITKSKPEKENQNSESPEIVSPHEFRKPTAGELWVP